MGRGRRKAKGKNNNGEGEGEIDIAAGAVGWYKEWYRLDEKKRGKQRARRLQDSLAKVRAAEGRSQNRKFNVGPVGSTR